MKITTTPARKDSDPEEMDGHRVWRDTSEVASAEIELTRNEVVRALNAWEKADQKSYCEHENDAPRDLILWAKLHRRSFDKHFPGTEDVEPENIDVVITG